MYACLYTRDDSAGPKLVELARMFSPAIEITAPGTVVFSIRGLGRLFGTPHQVASEIARRGADHCIMASLAIASNPDAAVLAATNLEGVTIIPPGGEAEWLGKIPLQGVPMQPELLETLRRWGLRALGDVAALPPIGLAERLGQEGVRLYELAHGRVDRPLRQAAPPTSYSEKEEMEDAVMQLEPLLFVLARMLGDICRRLDAQSTATNRIELRLRLESNGEHSRVLELPVPQNDPKTLLKLLHLDLEAHSPAGAVTAIALSLNPVEPRTLQRGLFLPLAPEPEKLQITLARITALVGEGNAGTPELLDTHRPDAFRMLQPLADARGSVGNRDCKGAVLTLRFFRPSLPAKVRLRSEEPYHVAARGVQGEVVEASGPWRSSGDWWSRAQWARDEWDVSVDRSGLYRIYCDLDARRWFVEGVYD